jgi:predicted site-specific integrase-resolvase
MLSISEAAKSAGISRTTLYKKYIDTGVITVKRVNDLPRIDASDLIRVFGNINAHNTEQSLTLFNDSEHNLNNRINELEREVEKLKMENEKLVALNQAQERHLADMRRGFELIEHASGKKRGGWWKLWQ